MTFELRKRHSRGTSATYRAATGAKIIVNSKTFAGDPPATLEVDWPDMRQPTEQELAREAKKNEKRESLQERTAKAQVRAEKAAAKASKLAAQLAALGPSPEASGQETGPLA
jgi:hypothetical protein